MELMLLSLEEEKNKKIVLKLNKLCKILLVFIFLIFMIPPQT